MKRLYLSLLALLLLALPANAAERWVVYYGDKHPASALEPFDLIVLDSDHHPPLETLSGRGKILLGYISLGEAEKYRSYYKAIAKKKLLLHDSTLWKNHVVIDVRNPKWAQMVVDELIPPILAQGFDGIMIDTLDSAIEPELSNPKQFPGMKQGAIDLIRAIRVRYPDIKIMVNRGLEILPDIAADIDMVMAESIYTDWVKNPKRPQLVPKQEYMQYLDMIAKGQEISPSLRIYSLDYWNMNDKRGVKKIYARQREQGFIPYVSTRELNRIFVEPK